MEKNRLCNLSYINGLQNAKEMGKFYWKTNSRLENRRRPFTHQKMPFYHAKEHLLQRKRASFTTLFITSCIPKGYKPENNT